MSSWTFNANNLKLNLFKYKQKLYLSKSLAATDLPINQTVSFSCMYTGSWELFKEA
jgi:hypothetical protein